MARPYEIETGLERAIRPLSYRGKDYFSFDARPASRAASNYPEIARMLAVAASGPAIEPVVAGQPHAGILALMATPRLWLERFLERRRMARDAESFTDEMLSDFGLSRREARAIARTPFWRAID